MPRHCSALGFGCLIDSLLRLIATLTPRPRHLLGLDSRVSSTRPSHRAHPAERAAHCARRHRVHAGAWA